MFSHLGKFQLGIAKLARKKVSQSFGFFLLGLGQIQPSKTHEKTLIIFLERFGEHFGPAVPVFDMA